MGSTMEPIRLNKFLVEAGKCSRREADRWITAGRVAVNGVTAVLGTKVSADDRVTVDGEPVDATPKERVYLAYHKPVGVICTSDPNAQDNIIEAIGYPERIFHIGRLDVASSGLILLTNDGNIVNKILRAEGKHDKEYVVTVDHALTQEFLERMAAGVDLDGHKTLPARVTQVDEKTFRIVLVEGRNRQIRRMCEVLGYTVSKLVRVRIMHIELSDLPVGRWRNLTPGEVEELLTATG